MGRKKQIDYARMISDFNTDWAEREKLDRQRIEREAKNQTDLQRIIAEWRGRRTVHVPQEVKKFFEELAEEKGTQEAKRIFLAVANDLKYRQTRGASYTIDNELLALADFCELRGGDIGPMTEALFERKKHREVINEETGETGETDINPDTGSVEYKPSEKYGKSPTALRKRIDDARKAREQHDKNMKEFDAALDLNK